MGNKKGVNTSSVEYSPARKKRRAARRKRQEASWAAKAGPVVITQKVCYIREVPCVSRDEPGMSVGETDRQK